MWVFKNLTKKSLAFHTLSSTEIVNLLGPNLSLLFIEHMEIVNLLGNSGH